MLYCGLDSPLGCVYVTMFDIGMESLNLVYKFEGGRPDPIIYLYTELQAEPEELQQAAYPAVPSTFMSKSRAKQFVSA